MSIVDRFPGGHLAGVKSLGVRVVLLAALAVVIGEGLASGGHAPARLVGLGVLSGLWLVNAVSVVRRVRRLSPDLAAPFVDLDASDADDRRLDATAGAEGITHGGVPDWALQRSRSRGRPSTRQRLSVFVFAAVVLGFSLAFFLLALNAGGPASTIVIVLSVIGILSAGHLLIIALRPGRR